MVIAEKHKKSMYYALFQMMNRKISKFTSRDYSIAKKAVSEAMKSNNPMHDPDTAARFRRKRPDQSEVAKRRNQEYWSTRARPLRTFECAICSTPVTTRIPTKTTCSKSCSTKLQHKNK